jgi:hypothetical protein
MSKGPATRNEKSDEKKNTTLNGRGRSADIPTGIPELGIGGHVGERV